MANIIPVSQMIDRPDFLGAGQQGLQYGQHQRALREQRADQQQLRTLAPQVIAGDPGATAQAAVIDPQAAGAYQGAGDSIARRAEGLVRLLEEADKRDPREAQALWQAHGVPFARQFSQGTEPTTDWAQAKPMLANLKARIEMAKAAQNPATEPTGFRELHMKALAAGYQPGTPEYQNAMRVGIGTEGRAATGGFGFERVVGADGRERMGRTNPRTGVFEVYDEASGNFTPMGGPAALNGGSAPEAQSGAADVSRVDMERDIELANQMVAAGIPAEQVDSFLQARGARASVTTPQLSNPALGVSQSPAEKKFAEESGQQRAQLDVLRERGQIEAQNASDKAAAENAADSNKTAITKAPQLQNVERGLDRIDDALSALESGTIGDTGPLDQYYQRFTPQGQELEAAIGAIQNDMLALTRVPGVGSQSDLEAKIANMKYPSLGNDPAVNRRNLQQLRAFMRDLGESLGRAPQQAETGGWSIQRVP